MVMPNVSMSTHSHIGPFPAHCRMNRAGSKPFPVLTIGDYFELYPSLEQLAELRDAITAFLESPEAKAEVKAR